MDELSVLESKHLHSRTAWSTICCHINHGTKLSVWILNVKWSLKLKYKSISHIRVTIILSAKSDLITNLIVKERCINLIILKSCIKYSLDFHHHWCVGYKHKCITWRILTLSNHCHNHLLEILYIKLLKYELSSKTLNLCKNTVRAHDRTACFCIKCGWLKVLVEVWLTPKECVITRLHEWIQAILLSWIHLICYFLVTLSDVDEYILGSSILCWHVYICTMRRNRNSMLLNVRLLANVSFFMKLGLIISQKACCESCKTSFCNMWLIKTVMDLCNH